MDHRLIPIARRAGNDAPALADPEQASQSVLERGSHVSAETFRRLAFDAS